MLLPLIEDDFVLAKMLPICAVLDNTAITVAIPNATIVHVLWRHTMLLTVSFSSPWLEHYYDLDNNLTA